MQYRKLKDLKKLEGNPRIIKEKQFKTLCDSIRDNKEYFEARPLILSNRTGELVIIAGNQRYEAAKSVKLKEVPTFLIEGLTETKEREIVIRDNISNGEFDFDALANTWSELPLTEWGIDLPKHYLNNDQLEQDIVTEEERSEAGRTADEAAKAITAKIKKVCEENPQKVNSAMAVIVNNGRGNAVLFLADPNTADIVQELKRYADAGEHSPLECLMRSLIENNA